MTKNAVFASYFRSFLWLLLFVATAVAVTNIVELVYVDFLHVNPHRPRSNAIWMIEFFTPLFALVGAIGAILVFALPHCLQAALANYFISRFGGRARFWVLGALPIIAVVTWYCYDYLTPTDFNLGINTPADWKPYQHGLTAPRYLMAFAAQAPVALFAVLFLDAGLRGGSRTALVLAGLAIAALFGALWGHHLALDQYRFV